MVVRACRVLKHSARPFICLLFYRLRASCATCNSGQSGHSLDSSCRKMTPTKAKTNPALTSALEAVANLCGDAFDNLDHSSGLEAFRAHSEIKQRNIQEKSAGFYRSFLPLRTQMIALLADSYRRYFKLALAHPSQTGGDPENWAWIQLQPAIHAALEWMRDWYILACDGENRRMLHIASIDFVPGQTVTTPIPAPDSAFLPPTGWRAPAWLFGVSLAFFGIGMMKPQHVPRTDSGERLGLAHSRLLLKGAKRVFLWDLAATLERVRNEEIAAAGAVRVEPVNVQRTRTPNKRKGWQRRLKLYSVIQKILVDDPSLQGMDFCADLDRRHALPLLDWMESGEWREGLTWKEAWSNPQLRRKIRRVRQEAQKKS